MQLRRSIVTVSGLLAVVTFGICAASLPAGAEPTSGVTVSSVGMPAIFGFDILQSFAKLLEAEALGMLSAIMKLIDSTEPNLYQTWFTGQYKIMLNIGLALAAPIALVAAIEAIVKGGLKQLITLAVGWLPLAIIGSVAAIICVGLLQAVDNEFATFIKAGIQDDFTSFANNVKGVSDTVELALAVMMLCLVLILAAFGLWFEMALRAFSIYLCVAFVPMAAALGIWQPMRKWIFVMIEMVCTMIFSKSIALLCLKFGLGVSIAAFGGAGAGTTNDGWDRIGLLSVGVVVIVMTALSFPALLAFVMAPGHHVPDRKSYASQLPTAGSKIDTRNSAAKLIGKTNTAVVTSGPGRVIGNILKGR